MDALQKSIKLFCDQATRTPITDLEHKRTINQEYGVFLLKPLYKGNKLSCD